jgi:hypothetical protein
MVRLQLATGRPAILAPGIELTLTETTADLAASA